MAAFPELVSCCDSHTAKILGRVQSFPAGSDGKESPCNVGDLGLIPGSGRSLVKGDGNPSQYPCLENSMDRGAWRAVVRGVTKSWV